MTQSSKLLASLQMKQRLPGFWLLVAGAISMCVSGCTQEDSPLLGVTGTVKFTDGSVVQGEMATIVFQPNRSGSVVPPKSASGTIEPDGSFRLMTDQPGDGAHPGSYKVVLKVWENYREQKAGVDKKYTDLRTTPLEATVSANSREFDFIVDQP